MVGSLRLYWFALCPVPLCSKLTAVHEKSQQARAIADSEVNRLTAELAHLRAEMMNVKIEASALKNRAEYAEAVSTVAGRGAVCGWVVI